MKPAQRQSSAFATYRSLDSTSFKALCSKLETYFNNMKKKIKNSLNKLSTCSKLICVQGPYSEADRARRGTTGWTVKQGSNDGAIRPWTPCMGTKWAKRRGDTDWSSDSWAQPPLPSKPGCFSEDIYSNDLHSITPPIFTCFLPSWIINNPHLSSYCYYSLN